MEYEKIDMCKDYCMIFYKGHKNEIKCLKCGKPRFIEVVNEDGEKVMTNPDLALNSLVGDANDVTLPE
jgi:hypothetical protein